MAGLVISKLSNDVYIKLKERAARHGRSINEEALVLLDEALRTDVAEQKIPPPYKGEFPLSQDFIDDAKRETRSYNGLNSRGTDKS